MRILRLLNTVMAIVGIIGMTVSDAMATAAIVVLPQQGGSTLNFGTVTQGQSVSRTVDATMVFDEGDQYEVYYEITQPLENQNGTYLALEAITFHTVAGSNNSGTLYLTNDQPINYPGQTLMYVSTPTGGNDDFEIVYTAHGGEVNDGGTFTGTIRYVLRSVDGSTEVDYFMDVSVTFDLDLTVSITGSTGANLVKMTYSDGPPIFGPYFFTINFSENISNQTVNIYQDFDTLPLTNNGLMLAADAVKFHTAGGNNGTKYYTTPTPLTPNQILLYTSTAASDSLQVYFDFNNLVMPSQVAGYYTSEIVYKIEWAGEIYELPVYLEVEILPIFKLDVIAPVNQTPQGQFILGMDLTPSSQPQELEFIATITNNTGQTYKLMQTIPTPLTNSEGFTIPGNMFQLKTTQATGQGTPVYPNYVSVQTGIQDPLFLSHFTGSTAGVKIRYRLVPSVATAGIPGQAGAYQAVLVLTAVQD